MFSLKSPHRGDSNDSIQHTIFNMNKKNTLNYPKSAAMGFFPRDSKMSSSSRGKRAISVRAIEVLLYFVFFFRTEKSNWQQARLTQKPEIPGLATLTFISPSADFKKGSCQLGYWRKHVHFVLGSNRLAGLSLPRNSVVRLTNHPDVVYRGRKTTTSFFFVCLFVCFSIAYP